MVKYIVRALERLNSQRGQALRQSSGQALAEYSLILAFIAAACVLALTALGLALAGHIDVFADAFP